MRGAGQSRSIAPGAAARRGVGGGNGTGDAGWPTRRTLPNDDGSSRQHIIRTLRAGITVEL